MIRALAEQLDILRDALEHMKAGEHHYYKTVAAILRILVLSGKPLLLELADYYRVELMVTIDGPPHKAKTMTLREYLDQMVFASGTHGVRMTAADFALNAAQEDGLAHEDWARSHNYSVARAPDTEIGGRPAWAQLIIPIGRTVLNKGQYLLGNLEERQPRD